MCIDQIYYHHKFYNSHDKFHIIIYLQLINYKILLDNLSYIYLQIVLTNLNIQIFHHLHFLYIHLNLMYDCHNNLYINHFPHQYKFYIHSNIFNIWLFTYYHKSFHLIFNNHLNILQCINLKINLQYM